MEHKRRVSLLQKVGAYWLLVTEEIPNVVAQRIIKEPCAADAGTLNRLWELGWSVQINIGEDDEWLIIGTQWKEGCAKSPQKCSVDSNGHMLAKVESEWNLNRRVISVLYHSSIWALLTELVEDDLVISQQIVKTTNFPGNDIQQMWAQGKRVLLINGGPSDWTIIAEKTSQPVQTQALQAGLDVQNEDPSAVPFETFDFKTHLSRGLRLINATFQPSSNLYAFLWEHADPLHAGHAQEIFLQTSFPTDQLAALGYKLETR